MTRNNQHWLKRLLSETTGLRRLAIAALMFPIQVLLFPLRAMGILQPSEIKEAAKHGRRRSWQVRIARGLRAALMMPLHATTQISNGLAGLIARMKVRDWLILTAVSVVVGVAGYFVIPRAFFGESENPHHRSAQIAFRKGEFELAKSHFEAFRKEETPTDEQEYFWATLLSLTGEKTEASKLIDKLAPDDAVGYSLAHRAKVLNISDLLATGNDLLEQDPLVLKKLKWHLEHCEDRSPRVMEAWARLHLALGQYTQAVESLKETAKSTPAHHILIAEIYHRSKQFELRDRALAKAVDAIETQLSKDRMNHSLRIVLANVLARQGKLKEAEAALLTGLSIRPDQEIKQGISRFYVLWFDLAKRQRFPIERQLELITKALKHQSTNKRAYERLLDLYRNSESDAQTASIRKLLQETVAGENVSALAHLALSNVLWQEGEMEQATFHLESAYKLDPGMSRVANDLAWMLAHAKTPDLDRALELAKMAVSHEPKNARIHDTLGTIHLLRGEHREAVSEFGLALTKMGSDPKLHDKLAQGYQALGMEDMARLHQERAASIRGTQKK